MTKRADDTTESFEELFVQGSGAEAWAARTTQPLDALTRPAEWTETRVPVVELVTWDDLDGLASGLAATQIGSRKRS